MVLVVLVRQLFAVFSWEVQLLAMVTPVVQSN
jgi:hypothetical protein